MASTPVNINFNVTGQQMTIAQINAVSQAYQQAAQQTLNTFQSNVQSATATAKQGFKDMTDGAGTLWNKMNDLSFKLFLFQMLWGQIQGAAQGFYNVALKSNEDLRQSILSTQASLVAVADVYEDGIKIEDSTEAIKALGPAIEEAIKNIRIESLDLVGVTSEQLIPLFQILANNAGKIANQSKQWADPIEAAQKLTISFAAGLGTLGIPIRQARQEIQSMLQGYIDQNSLMAKQLGISNDQVRLWQKQGVLVDELLARLQPLVDGNKIAAQSLSGIGSNILEVIQEIQRVGTEPLYEPIVAQLKGVYDWLKQNQEALTQGLISVVDFLTGLASQLAEAFAFASEKLGWVGEQVGNIGETLGTFTGEAITGVVAGITTVTEILGVLLQILTPVFAALNAILTVLNDLGITRVAAFAGAIALLVAAGGALATQAIALLTLLTNIGVALTGVAAGTIATGSAFGGLTAATTKLNTALAALQANLGVLGITMKGLIAFAGPAALIVAGLAAAWASLETDKLKYVNEGLDKELAEADKITSHAMGLKIRLLEEQKKAMRDGVIDKDERSRMDAIKYKLDADKILLEEQVNQLKELRKNANEDQRLGIDKSIESLQKTINQIDPSEIEIRMKGLTSLGDAYKKLSNDAAEALTRLKENQYSNPTEADQDSKILINNTKQEIELGILSLDQARSRYAEISKLSYLSAETRIAAEKELVNLIKLEGDRQVQNFKNQQERIQQFVNDGYISQIKGEELTTQSKLEEAEKRLRITRQAIAEQERIERSHGMTGDSDAKRKLLAEEEALETEITKLNKDSRDQRNRDLITNFDERLTLLASDKEARLIGEEDFYNQSMLLNVLKLEEQISQTKDKLKKLAETDKEGREALLAQIAQYEGQQSKLAFEAIERNNKILVDDFNERLALLARDREQRLIGEEEFYQRSLTINKAKLDEQIRQNRERLDTLAKSDKEGREAIIAIIAQLETQKAKLINDSDQRLLQQRVQQIKISTEILKLELERANQVLSQIESGLGNENKALELGNRAIATRKSLLESLAAVEQSYRDLNSTSQSIELSRAERALDYTRKLQDEKIKGTLLEKVYQEELAKIGGTGKRELDLIKEKQQKEAEIFNTKLNNLLKEQELQKQLLELDIQREESQLRQAVNQEKMNVLKAQQAYNTENMKVNEAIAESDAARLELEQARKSKDEQRIAQAQLQADKAELKVNAAFTGRDLAERGIDFAQESLGMAEDNLSRAGQIAENRRTILRNQQNNQRQQINEEGERLGVGQRVEQATYLDNNPDAGGYRGVDAPVTNRIDYTRYGMPEGTGYEVSPTGDSRLDGMFADSQRNYRNVPSETERINRSIDRKISGFNGVGNLPSPETTRNLSPQASLTEVLPNQLNQLIALVGEIKGGLGTIASATPVNGPVINNNFASAEDPNTWAKVRNQVLNTIDNVIPKMA